VVRHRRNAEGDVHFHRLRSVRVLGCGLGGRGSAERYVESAQTLGATRAQIVWKVLVALALPDIYNSLRHLFGLAFGYIMLAELINAQHGLGYLLMSSQRRGLSEHIILILMVIGLLAWGIDRALYWFQRGLFPYRVVEE
jgi:NitT/TauT family transport system permease protein